MAKMLYSATMSLDGFIAGAGGDMHWLLDHLGPNDTATEIVPQIGALLVGRRTFDGDDPHKGTESEGAFGGAWHGPQIVLTHHAPETPVPDTTFVDDLGAAVDKAKAAAGDKYVNVLGADVARQCLEAGLLDEMLIFIAPVLLGDGTRLYEHPGGSDIKLERMSFTSAPKAANLWFRVVRT
jgi:dihydrofolate reductase